MQLRLPGSNPSLARSDAPMVSAMTLPITITAFITALISWQSPGTAVYAAASGTVVISREDGFWGGIVTIDHGGGWKSIYRCLTPDVVYGDTPEGGEIIGYIQETTTAEGGQEAHLHFELYLNDEEVDPAEWI